MDRRNLRKQYTREQIEKALELERAGWKEPAIAKACGINPGSINRFLDRYRPKLLLQEIARLQRKIDESVAPNAG